MKLEPHISGKHVLGVRQTNRVREVELAQRLRYKVFHDEMGAEADDVFDHMIG